jgi:dihydroorotate dehydrogenase
MPIKIPPLLDKSWYQARSLNFYPLLRPLLFRMDAEEAHDLAIKALAHGFIPKSRETDPAILKVKAFGLDFANPLGAAPGLDKQAHVIDGFLDMGFSHIEVGSVTLRPQPGNQKPRLFRIAEARGLINRFGWNSDGADVCARRMTAWKDTLTAKRGKILGVNIGFNKDSQDPIGEYVECFIRLAPSVDYAVISVSTPNSPGVRDLQRKDPLSELLTRVMEARQRKAPTTPLLLKISPDIDDTLQAEIAEVVLNAGIQGLVVGNTTLTRPAVIPANSAKEAGGFSGPAMLAPTTKLLANMYNLTQRKIPLIANCGVFTGADAYAKIRAGASLVQIYTALIYEGPCVVPRIKRELAALLRRDGYSSVTDAIGADQR